MIFENIILSLVYSVCAFKADCFLQLNGYKIGKGFWVYFKTMYFLLSAAFFAVWERGLVVLVGCGGWGAARITGPG